MKMLKVFSFLTALLVFILFSGFYQDPGKKVKVTLGKNQTEEQFNRDKEQCLTNADQQFSHTKHKTLKSGGAGAGIGAVAGKILGKPGAGAVIGGAAGTYRGHKKSSKDQKEFNDAYASCLREKGYSVEVQN